MQGRFTPNMCLDTSRVTPDLRSNSLPPGQCHLLHNQIKMEIGTRGGDYFSSGLMTAGKVSLSHTHTRHHFKEQRILDHGRGIVTQEIHDQPHTLTHKPALPAKPGPFPTSKGEIKTAA